MYCPNCKQEYDGRFCPECGTKLIEKPAVANDIPGINLGDANAISGGLNVNASKNIHNEDRSIHNITNTTSTVNNITQVAAQKTEMELLQERKTLYMNECKRAYEDNILEQDEKFRLDSYRMELGLDEATADKILDDVRLLVMRNASKNELTGLAKIKLKQLSDALKKNEIQAIMRQLDGIEALAGKFANDELQYKYHLVLSALRHEKCIKKYESSKVDSYWESYWSSLAYAKAGKMKEAEDIAYTLGDKYPNYPEDNATLLASAVALIVDEKDEAADFLNNVAGDYSPSLQRFAETLYIIIEPDTAKEMGATEQGCAFYLVNFFNADTTETKEETTTKTKSEAKPKDATHTQNTNQPEAVVAQDSEADILKKKWLQMTAEAYRMLLEAEDPNDAICILNMSIPPAMAGIPQALMLTAIAFNAFEQHEESVNWANRLMALDPQNEDADVMMAKAALYEEGVGPYAQNAEYAIAFYRAAAAKGNMDALCGVADMYYEGKIVDEDHQMALVWAKAAYEAKNAYGLFVYGRAYYEGKSIVKDTLTGKRLIREAAGMKDSAYNMGTLFAEQYMKEHNIK